MRTRIAALALLTLPLLAACGGSSVDGRDYKWVHTTDERTGIELACFVGAGRRSMAMHCVEVTP